MQTEVTLCKDCIHRPFYDPLGSHRSLDIWAPRPDGVWDDETCPFLCDDPYYNRMPKDDFFCRYGEQKT